MAGEPETCLDLSFGSPGSVAPVCDSSSGGRAQSVGRSQPAAAEAPRPELTVTTKITFDAHVTDDRVGLILMGSDYSYLGVRRKADGLYLSQTICRDADQGAAERESAAVALPGNVFYLRA